MKYIKKIEELSHYDVAICGGGPAGCAAALSARREGLSVVLIEETGQLGGMAVSGLVSQLLGGRTQEGEWVVGGLFRHLVKEAERDGCAIIPSLVANIAYHPYGWYNWFIHGIPIDPNKMALFLDRQMSDAGVDVLLFTKFVDVEVRDSKISSIIILEKQGLASIPVNAVIDATGNADVVFAAGCPTIKGREKDGKMTPSSLIFHVYNVNTEKLSNAIKLNHDPKFRDLITELRKKRIWNFPYDIFICTKLLEEGEYFINTIRLTGVDGTDSSSVSEGMRKGREEVFLLMNILNEYFPGFENARLKAIAPSLGIRETRRIKGDYILKISDLAEGNDFYDSVGFSMYGWDLPDPEKPSIQPFANDSKEGFKATVSKSLYTPIPYRIMIPKGINNLACAGRCVSAEGQALGPIRVMAPCMAMGEAVGEACSLVLKHRVSFSMVNTEELRSRLRSYGCIVDKDKLPVIHPRVDQV